MSRLEGARKCGRRLGLWVNVWTVRGWTGRLACHGGFQFENSVKEHTKKRNEVYDSERNKNGIPLFSIPTSISLARASELILEVFVFLLVIRNRMRKGKVRGNDREKRTSSSSQYFLLSL
jgi:hypothetical protein